ncbi:MAG TPA: MogA/MoaB family molybdenum cofactor biosynthesis protein [Candidatus Dormibacteraeota bacterium]|nr:MogA/MoaB family molybdenum cofactor biosynthesis protein [Candidatus Dormibacteraeota bacterium]
MITVSDRCSAGQAEDRSGPALAHMLEEAGFPVVGRSLVPDEVAEIRAALREAGADLVVSTGGTGLAARDVTPQATSMEIDYEVPGLAEEIRRVGVASTPMAVLSRGLAAVRGRSLVLNLPGSERGATESLAAVLPVLGHALQQLAGRTEH